MHRKLHCILNIKCTPKGIISSKFCEYQIVCKMWRKLRCSGLFVYLLYNKNCYVIMIPKFKLFFVLERYMIPSEIGNTFRITGPLWGEYTAERFASFNRQVNLAIKAHSTSTSIFSDRRGITATHKSFQCVSLYCTSNETPLYQRGQEDSCIEQWMLVPVAYCDCALTPSYVEPDSCKYTSIVVIKNTKQDLISSVKGTRSFQSSRVVLDWTDSRCAWVPKTI